MKSSNLPNELLITEDHALITKRGIGVNEYLRNRRKNLRPVQGPQEVVLMDRAYVVELIERSERLASLEASGAGYNLAA